MSDWQAAAVRLANDYEELRRVLAAAQPTLEASNRVVEAWRAHPRPELFRVVNPDLADALDALAGVVGDEEGT